MRRLLSRLRYERIRRTPSTRNSPVDVHAGGWDANPLIHIPAGVYSVFKDPSVNWNWESEPEAGCGGRKIELPRGKVVGGSSSINAMVYMRGHPLDYDGWADADPGMPLSWRRRHGR